MRLLDFIVRRSVPARAPGGNGTPDLVPAWTPDFLVPVATPRPQGRVEWAEVGPFLYGIDRAGTIFRGGRVDAL